MRPRAAVAILLLALCACQASAGDAHLPVETGSAPGATDTPPIEATLPIAPAGGETEPTPAFIEPQTTPLRFLLPTPGAQPVSGWRPPLYDVPWALTPYDHFYFTRPIGADQINWPLPGYRYGGVFFSPEVVHSGVDIPAEAGTPVLAAGPGTVVWAGWGLYSGNRTNTNDPYGLAVAVRHDFGYQGKPLFTVYAHMERVDVAIGQWVDTGEQLGLVGQTGFTTGVHLHFEVRWGPNEFASTYNPELWLAPPQGWGVLAGRVMGTHDYYALLSSHIVNVRSNVTGQWRTVRTYGSGSINADPYYQENMVLSDLPAGSATVQIDFLGTLMETEVEILPGRVTYFKFNGYRGFNVGTPATPTAP